MVRISNKKMEGYLEKWITITCEINEVAKEKGCNKKSLLDVVYQIQRLNGKNLINVDVEESNYLDHVCANPERYNLNHIFEYKDSDEEDEIYYSEYEDYDEEN